MFSKTCEYGIRATIYVAEQSQKNSRVSLREISEAIGSPIAFTAKVLQSLRNHGVLVSVKGATGGYEIPQEQLPKISLCDIVHAIDGKRLYTGCALGLPLCDEIRPCPLHDNFKAIRNDLKKMLESTSIISLTQSLEEGLVFIKG